MTLKISCSKSSSITFHGSPGMRDQVETQKEWSQLTSIHQNSKHYLLKAGSRKGRQLKMVLISKTKKFKLPVKMTFSQIWQNYLSQKSQVADLHRKI